MKFTVYSLMYDVAWKIPLRLRWSFFEIETKIITVFLTDVKTNLKTYFILVYKKQIFVTEFKYENVWSTEVEEAVNIYTEGKEPSISGVAAAAAKSLQSCPTLCDPIDGSPPGSPVPGILQARTLEWVAISFSSAWKWKVKVRSLSCVQPSVTPWTAAYQAYPSMGFSRQEYWSGVPLPSPIM